MLSWDRTHDWVVHRCFNDLARVTIRFAQPSPSVSELLALRSSLADFRDIAPAKLRDSITTGALPLGEMPTPEARSLIERATAAGLKVEVNSASYVSYLPFDRTTGCAWLIEDDAKGRAVAEEMIAAGVPVQYIEA